MYKFFYLLNWKLIFSWKMLKFHIIICLIKLVVNSILTTPIQLCYIGDDFIQFWVKWRALVFFFNLEMEGTSLILPPQYLETNNYYTSLYSSIVYINTSKLNIVDTAEVTGKACLQHSQNINPMKMPPHTRPHRLHEKSHCSLIPSKINNTHDREFKWSCSKLKKLFKLTSSSK